MSLTFNQIKSKVKVKKRKRKKVKRKRKVLQCSWSSCRKLFLIILNLFCVILLLYYFLLYLKGMIFLAYSFNFPLYKFIATNSINVPFNREWEQRKALIKSTSIVNNIWCVFFSWTSSLLVINIMNKIWLITFSIKFKMFANNRYEM